MRAFSYAAGYLALATLTLAGAVFTGRYAIDHLDAYLHESHTYTLPFLHGSGRLALVVLLTSALFALIGFSRRVPSLTVGSALYFAGGFANLWAMSAWGGVPDFIEVGPALLSVGDVLVAVAWGLITWGVVALLRRDARRAGWRASLVPALPRRRG